MKELKVVNKENANAFVRSRINSRRKDHVGRILKKLGMNHSEAINLFYAQIELLEGLPFNVRIPNELTQKVLSDSKKGKNLKGFHTKEEFFEDLGL